MFNEINKENNDISQIEMFVIDVLRYDIETIPLIVNRLNNGGPLGWRFAWPQDFNEAEVIQALKKLIQKGLVRPLREDETLKKIINVKNGENIWSNPNPFWFELTEKGWQVWDGWDNPPIEKENGE